MKKKLILTYGIIGGIVSSILGTLNWLLIAKHVGVDASQIAGYLSIAVSLLCIPFGIRYFRDKYNNQSVRFGQAFLIGLGITVTAAFVMALHSILFFVFQKDEFIEWQKAEMNPTELAAFNEQLAQMPEYAYTPWFQGIIMFFMVFLIGAVINLLSSLFLKK